MNVRSCSARLAATASVFFALALLPARGGAAEQEIQPLPPDGTAYGQKMPDWAVAYLQWLFSIPAGSSPMLGLDTTGVRSGVGQRSPVWFVPPYAVGSSGTLTMTVPEGQAVLVSPAGSVWADTPGAMTEDQLLALDSGYLDQIKVLEVSMDGLPVTDIKPYRLKTPVFSIPLAPGNLWDAPVTAGKEARIVAAGAGYWFLYPPLPLGKHVLSVRQEGTDPDTGETYKSEWTYNLIVRKPNEPLQ